MKLLVCGERSFAATGLVARLARDGYEIHTFSRGPTQRSGTSITGDVFDMSANPHFDDNYDHVINFIIIKNGSVDENLRYAKSLVAFCQKSSVRCLLHVSSISAYSSDATHVTEDSPIAAAGTPRGPYASIKQEVDHVLIASKQGLRVAFLRPGYILADDDSPLPLAGITRRLFGGVSLVLGSRRTTLPTLKRQELHEAIARIVNGAAPQEVYLLFANDGMTKFAYANRATRDRLLPLPRWPALAVVRMLRWTHVFSPVQQAQVEGLFRETHFDSSGTEAALEMRFRA